MDIDAPVERGRQGEHHRAFQLLGYAARLARVPQSFAQTPR